MSLEFTTHGTTGVIAVTGSIDALNAGELTHLLSERIAGGQSRLVLDLEKMDFMSSAGLRLLLQAAKDARQKGGDLRLSGASPALEKMLKLSGFTSILKVFLTIDQAVDSYAT